MKVLIIYDSLYGNTRKIAQAMGKAFLPAAEVTIVEVGQTHISDIKGADLVIVGSPTHGGRPKPTLQAFLDALPAQSLKGIRVAVFDTRICAAEQNFALQTLIKLIGYASPRVARSLQSKGGQLIAEPEGFIVDSKEGPVRNGELERAENWAKKIFPPQEKIGR